MTPKTFRERVEAAAVVKDPLNFVRTLATEADEVIARLRERLILEQTGGRADRLEVLAIKDQLKEVKAKLRAQIDGTNAQTFYVIKRDEEPRYWNPGFGWQEKPMITTEAGEINRWKRDLDLQALLSSTPTARIVKVKVEEMDENI